MKFIEVKEVPETANAKGLKKIRISIVDRLHELMKMNIRVARVECAEGEYSSIESLQYCFRSAIQRHDFPIDVYWRSGDIYLVRRDL